MKITVIDSIMGSGKTSWAMMLMDTSPYLEEPDNKFIYVTPYLSEITRIKESARYKKFYEPLNFGEGKQESLKTLLECGHNIATTHALFRALDTETLQLIKDHNYTLILDEVLEIIEPIPIKKGDVKLLKDAGAIYEDEDGRVHCIEGYIHKDGSFDELLEKIRTSPVMCINNNYFIWVMQIEVLESFKNIYILTYLFDCQLLKYYFELYKIKYEIRSVVFNEFYPSLVPYIDNKSNIKKLINICEDDKLNEIGAGKYSLSKNWYKRASKHTFNQFKNHISNFIKNKMKAKTEDILWTTFKGGESDNDEIFIKGDNKSYVDKLKGNGYSSDECFAPCNARATNEYKDRTVVIYTINRFVNPNIESFFNARGIKVDSDKLALSSLLQWLYRSAIREGNVIDLYIPSSRMRSLLKDWMNDEGGFSNEKKD